MRLITFPGVFRPRSDSLLLAERARQQVEPGFSVLDPFAGSGILALAAALAGARATAIDVSRRAVACIRLNAALNRVGVRAIRGDMLAPVAGERFDLVVANPPYLPAARDGDPLGAARAWDAGADGRAILDPFCTAVPAHLEPGGRLLLVQSSVSDPQATIAILASAGLEVEVVERRLGGLGPLLSARAASLERRGLLESGLREEEIVVVSARRPGFDPAGGG
jgi:release factor glutamine methyltransferase